MTDHWLQRIADAITHLSFTVATFGMIVAFNIWFASMMIGWRIDVLKDELKKK